MSKLLLIIIFIITVANLYSADKINIVTEEWIPYSYTQNGKFTGIATEIVEAILKDSKLRYKIEVYSWARSLNYALNKKNTAIYSTAKTPQRANKFNWVGPLLFSETYLFKLKTRKDIEVKTLKDLNKYKIGFIRGDAIEDIFIDLGLRNGKNYELNHSEKANLKKFFHSRFDLIVFRNVGLKTKLKLYGYSYESIEKVLDLNHKEAYYLALSLDISKEIVEKLQKSLEKIKKNGFINKALLKYNLIKKEDNRYIVLDYSDFGPQVIAHELIGMDWWSWDSHGDSRPREYNIKVIVYKDISLEEIKKKFPVSKEEENDYRYLEYHKAVEFLDKYKKDDLLKHLSKTKEKINKKLLK